MWGVGEIYRATLPACPYFFPPCHWRIWCAWEVVSTQYSMLQYQWGNPKEDLACGGIHWTITPFQFWSFQFRFCLSLASFLLLLFIQFYIFWSTSTFSSFLARFCLLCDLLYFPLSHTHVHVLTAHQLSYIVPPLPLQHPNSKVGILHVLRHDTSVSGASQVNCFDAVTWKKGGTFGGYINK